MYVCIVVILLVIPAAAYNETDQFWSCPQSPETCLARLSDLDRENDCQTTNDCEGGAQCCYRGCVRKCEFPNPCEQVICKDGYLCEAREKPCKQKPCQLEATCLPEIQVRCVAPACATDLCQPGYERAKDRSGCPTCDCVRKQDCGPNCLTLCAYDFEEGPNGCPVCKCKPEPPNPCSNVGSASLLVMHLSNSQVTMLTSTCGRNEECRFLQVTCVQAPCPPIAMCVPTLLVQYENACSLTDPTTAGLPVLDSHNKVTELNCVSQSCPANTVCTSMGREIRRCCWQPTQERVLSPPKIGECPAMANSSEPTLTCQVDGECPRQQKCCYRKTEVASSRSIGYCTNPAQEVMETVPEMCQRAILFVRVILTWFGFC